MGTNTGGLQSLLQSLPSLYQPSTSSSPALRGGKAQTAIPLPGENTAPDAQAAVNRAFESITYRSQQTSLAVRFQQIASSVATSQQGAEGASTTLAQQEQLSFDFFFESRTEELVAFQERTGKLEDGLGGTQKSSFAALSQQISAKFEFSFSLSGEALAGFANAAEGAVSAEDVFNKLMAFAGTVLEKSDALFQDIFAMLGGSTATDSENFIDKFVGDITEAFQQLGLFGGGGEGATQTAGTSSRQMEFTFKFSAEIAIETTEVVQVQQSDPVILDLDNDGFDLTSYKDGARFDILGNGGQQNTAFVNGGDAFLAIDRNKDGVINSGKELFGDQNGASNGFEELRKLDSNRDGTIDKRDSAYADLRLFRDNGNGATEKGELLTLEEAGIASIDLKYQNTNQAAAGGNRIAQIASFTRTDGTKGAAGDAILNYTA